MTHAQVYSFRLKDFDSIYTLSREIAEHFPDPEHFMCGIYELLINALEHGNLGLGFHAKTGLVLSGKWQEEVTRRLALPENQHKEVEINLSHDAHECRLTIRDQGNGFSWREYIGVKAADETPNGRGLWIAFNSKFDRITYNALGNEVTCVSQFSHWLNSNQTKHARSLSMETE